MGFKGDQYVVVGKLLSEASGTFTVRVTGDKTGAKYLDDIVIDPCLRQPKIVEDSSSPSVIDHFDCIRPIPNVKKSKAQEFLQSLHAFLNIQQLLKKTRRHWHWHWRTTLLLRSPPWSLSDPTRRTPWPVLT